MPKSQSFLRRKGKNEARRKHNRFHKQTLLASGAISLCEKEPKRLAKQSLLLLLCCKIITIDVKEGQSHKKAKSLRVLLIIVLVCKTKIVVGHGRACASSRH